MKIKTIIGACAFVMACTVAWLIMRSIPSSDMPPSTLPLPTQALTTEVLGDFTFAYPAANGPSFSLTWEGVLCNGAVALSFPPQKVVIATSPSTACTVFNPNAQVLADYGKGYRSNDFEEIIHSQKAVTVNGIPMLRQIYSQGYWTDHGSGSGVKVFDTSSEGSIDHQLRYVFSDGSTFFIVTGWKAEPYIDQVAKTIQKIK